MNEFRLYISGNSEETNKAISNLKKYLSLKLDGDYSLHIINLLMDPGQAEADNIIVTPTIIKISPPSEKKIIGDIRAMQRILELLLG